MDLLRTIGRRLTLALCVVLLGAFALAPNEAHAATTQYQAYSACQAKKAQPGALAPSQQWWTCEIDPNAAAKRYCLPIACNVYVFYWDTDGGFPPSTACTLLPSVPISVTGSWSVGQGFQQTTTDSTTGQQVKCMMRAMSIVSPPTLNPYDGKWYTRVAFAPDATPSGGSGADGTAYNPDGTPAADTPSVPTPAPSTAQPAPKVCGGMCYDPNSDSYTYTDAASGKSVSVDGNTARSSSGGCASGVSGTICAGSPSAPAPPAPPASPISDPPTQVQSVDKTVQKNPATGANQTVTTVVYGTPGNKNTSGQQSGDSGPASSSSTGSKSNGNFSGGADCNTPPACSGDAVMCGVGRQQWYAMCMAHRDLTGTGDAPQTDHPDKSALWQDGGQGTGEGASANAGQYNMAGLGFDTSCPLHNLSVPLGSFGELTVPFENMCPWGGWLRAIVIGFALFAAVKITAGAT